MDGTTGVIGATSAVAGAKAGIIGAAIIGAATVAGCNIGENAADMLVTGDNADTGPVAHGAIVPGNIGAAGAACAGTGAAVVTEVHHLALA